LSAQKHMTHSRGWLELCIQAQGKGTYFVGPLGKALIKQVRGTS